MQLLLSLYSSHPCTVAFGKPPFLLSERERNILIYERWSAKAYHCRLRGISFTVSSFPWAGLAVGLVGLKIFVLDYELPRSRVHGNAIHHCLAQEYEGRKNTSNTTFVTN